MPQQLAYLSSPQEVANTLVQIACGMPAKTLRRVSTTLNMLTAWATYTTELNSASLQPCQQHKCGPGRRQGAYRMDAAVDQEIQLAAARRHLQLSSACSIPFYGYREVPLHRYAPLCPLLTTGPFAFTHSWCRPWHTPSHKLEATTPRSNNHF